MGWASFLEDIEKRLDDAMAYPRHHSVEMKRGSISVESLRRTNDILREKNKELLRVISLVKAEISAKRQTDFCKNECKRLKVANGKLAIKIKNLTENAPESFLSGDSPEGVRPNQFGLSQQCWDAKQRSWRARKAEDAAKRELKKAENARATAEAEYQKLRDLWLKNNPPPEGE
jgi:hypothetical protein